MSEFHPEWLADLGPWHAVGDTPFLARCLPSDPDGAILILRPWGPWEEQRWRAVFSPPDRDDDGQDWRHGEILTPDGRYWPDRESAEDALDAAWSAWRARYRASRGVAPADGRRHNLLVALTPSLLARIKALGFEVGSEGVLPWLVGVAEEMRAECDVLATYREATTTALGIESSSCAEDVAEAVNEMRLTLAAEQGNPAGAPSDGWTFHSTSFAEWWQKRQIVVQRALGGWKWRVGRRKFRPASTARAAMIAADKAQETP